MLHREPDFVWRLFAGNRFLDSGQPSEEAHSVTDLTFDPESIILYLTRGNLVPAVTK
jgi:hypothetical protein